MLWRHQEHVAFFVQNLIELEFVSAFCKELVVGDIRRCIRELVVVVLAVGPENPLFTAIVLHTINNSTSDLAWALFLVVHFLYYFTSFNQTEAF